MGKKHCYKLNPIGFIVLSIIFLLVISGIFSITNATTDKVNVHGYVKDIDTGETLPYANISLVGTGYGTAANTNGYFVLLNIPAGECTLKVDYIGYKSVQISFFATDNMKKLEVKLKQHAMQLQGVTITAENLQTMEVAGNPSEVRLSPRQLKTLPSVGEVDIFRSLQLLPGISAVNDGSAGLYIRGGTPDQNLVLFDGMTIYNVDHFFGFISAFNAEAVKDVRVFKGGFPAKFGGRTSSVVELTGKSGSYENFQAAGRLNLLSGNAVTQIPINGRGAWLVSFRRSHTDIVKSELYNKIFSAVSGQNRSDDVQTTNTGGFGRGGFQAQNEQFVPDFFYYDLNSKLTYQLTDNDIFSFSFYNGQDNLDESQDLGTFGFNSPNAAGGDSTASAVINDVTKWGNLGLSTKWSRAWNERIYSNLLVAYSNYFSESESGFGTRAGETGGIRQAFNSSEDNEIRDLTLRFDTEIQAHRNHKVELGVWHSRTEVDLLFSANDTISILDRNDKADYTAFYLQDKWQLIQPLELTVGMRATNYEPTQSTFYEPRASFNLSLNNKIKLKGAWGQYHQFVNRVTNENVLEGNRDFWLLADEQLEPSFAEHKILGLSYEDTNFLFDVEAYHKDLDNVSEFSQRFRRRPGQAAEELFFLGEGEAKGIEFLLQKKTGKLSGWVSYTLGKVEYTFDVFNDGNPFPADQDRRHEIKTVANYRFKKWNLAATWVFASGAPYTAPENQYEIVLLDGSTRSYIHVGEKNENRLPEYHRMDISLTREFKGNKFDWDLGISVFNLYNRSNVWYREYVLDTSPIVVRDVTTLGLVPTITVGLKLN